MNKHTISLVVGAVFVVFSGLCSAATPDATKPTLKPALKPALKPVAGTTTKKIDTKTLPQLKPSVRDGIQLKSNRPGDVKLVQVTPAQAMRCPDPAVVDLKMIHPRQGRDRRWVFFLNVEVKNVGGGDYRSHRGQQSVKLFRVNGGSRTLLKSADFPVLGAGQRLNTEIGDSVSGWHTSTEFAPDFEVVISYDPDIYIDGNEANDDCRKSNNKKRITGSEINRQLGQLAAM